MAIEAWGDRVWAVVGIVSSVICLSVPAVAQVIPDDTLGQEQSMVTRATIRGVDSDQIDGGARRGRNLFHSFQQFDVLEGRGAYFSNPDGVANIFSRVTGIDRSEIMGRLGVLGDANLFFMNPNGILFGSNSSLDVNGSFVGTTANAIQFGEQGFFSATNPELPSQLLTIDPSAFLFNQIPVGNIAVRSATPIVPQLNIAGLQVGLEENLSLLGGNVAVEGGGLNAFGGRIDIGAVRSNGIIGLNTNGSFAFPTDVQRGNVTFNASGADVRTLDRGGDIAITAQKITLTERSLLLAGILPGQGFEGSQAGDVTLNAAEQILIDQVSIIGNVVSNYALGNGGNIEITAPVLEILNGAQLDAITYGEGNAGNISVNATDRVTLLGSSRDGRFNSAAVSRVGQSGIGNGGSIKVTVPVLEVLNGAQLDAGSYGRGDAGSIIISTADRALFQGRSYDEQSGSGALSRIEESGIGNGGNIEITSPILEVLDGAQLTAGTLGQGNAGNVIIQATDHVIFQGGSAALSRVGEKGIGNGGNVEIISPILEVLDGARLTAGTLGRGNAGSVIINASGRVTFRGTRQFSSAALSRVEENGIGNGGNVEITAPILEVLNGAQLTASTFGRGNAGSVIIHATDRVTFQGIGSDGQSSGALSAVWRKGIGNGGNVEITSPILEVLNGAQLTASTFGRGNAGSVIINASDRVTFQGVSSDGQSSSALSDVDQNSIGNGGNIEITVPILQVLDGAGLTASTNGRGHAGSVIVNATSRVNFNQGGVFSTVGENGIGNGGNIEITSPILEVLNGSRLLASTLGQGDAGSVIINATDNVLVDGVNHLGFSSGIFASAEASSTGEGNSIHIDTPTLYLSNGAVINARTATIQPGGDITLNADTFTATSGGQVIASTLGTGQAGNITINADHIILSGRDITFTDRLNIFGREVTANENNGESGIFANTRSNSTGNGGTIRLSTASLSLSEGAQIAAFTFGSGNAGNIFIQNADLVSLDNSAISTKIGSDAILASSMPDQGNIDIQTRSLSLNNAAITASTAGQGNAGNITIRDADRITLSANSTISTAVEQNAIGQGGNIAINTDSLNLTDRSQITSSTSGTGNTGRIEIEADQLRLSNRSGITSSVNSGATGNSQRIALDVSDLFLNNDSFIAASTSGQGNAGNITIRDADRIRLNNSTISTAINLGATATEASNITLQTRSLNLSNNSNITASTAGRGDAGTIVIEGIDRNINQRTSQSTNQRTNSNSPADRVVLVDSVIATDVQGTGIGQGGNIQIRSNRLALDDSSRISARTRGQGQAGNLDIFAALISLSNDSRLLTNTSSDRNAGNITLTVNNRIAIDGNRSGIFASTTQGSRGNGGFIQLNGNEVHLDQQGQISAQSQGRGQAGRIQIQATGALNLNNRSTISTQSQRNQAGEIFIQADQIEATNSDITTAAQRSSGGNIRLSASQIRLNGDSDLRTNSGEAGGNITLEANSIIAFDDSDILAFARAQGGDIQLNTPAFFGNGYQSSSTGENPEELDGNDRTDLDASGQVSSGTISTPDTSFIQNSLSDLPETAIDAQALISSSCVVRRDGQSGSFTIPGTGGLPERPGELPRSRFPTGEVRSTSEESVNSEAEWQLGDPIVEPQGVYQLPDGRLVLSRECSH